MKYDSIWPDGDQLDGNNLRGFVAEKLDIRLSVGKAVSMMVLPKSPTFWL